jgi:hypothetical protein
MQITTIDSGGLEQIAREKDSDVIVLRGEALAAYVAAVSTALGRPFDVHGVTVLHGVRRRAPHPGEPVYVDADRNWFLGEPMPESFDLLAIELQQVRARVALLEQQLKEARALIDSARSTLEK